MSVRSPQIAAAAAAHAPSRRSARWGLGFWSLVVTQFQGAFNDNALKFLVIYLIVGMGLPDQQRDRLVLVVGALFALPFILFSMTGGYLADRFSKRSVTIGTKWMEVGVMIFALIALWRGNLAMEAGGVFLISSQGALFGPSKYGLLPELLPEQDLSWGNGVIELGTFLASITATVAAGYLAFYFRGQQHWSGVFLIGCTAVGLATSFSITRVPAANPSRRFSANPLGDLWEQLAAIGKDRVLTWAFVGNTYLWFLAALLQFTIVIYGHDILHIDERHISYLQAAVAVGIGVGSLVTGYLSDRKIEYGMIPLGAVGMTIFGFLSASHGLSLARAAAYLGFLGFFGGFYAVPLNALIQHRPDPARKGGIIAAANLFSFVGVFLAAGVYYLLAEGLHLGADRVFFAGACMTVVATLYAVLLLPDSVKRLALWTLAHTLYSVRVEGRENVPERGAALFLAPELSPVDALWLAASTDRPIRFLVSTDGASIGGTRADAKRADGRDAGALNADAFNANAGGAAAGGLLRLIDVRRYPSRSSGDSSDALLEAAAESLRRGEVVCLAGPAASARLSADAAELKRIGEALRDAGAPALAVQVHSPVDGALMARGWTIRWRWPRRIPARASLQFGEPIAAQGGELALADALAGALLEKNTARRHAM